jgi:recombination protein RecA
VAQTALSRFAAGLPKKYGEQRVVGRPAEFVSTGSLTLDYALRRGGWPVGQIAELVGPPDAGKSTVAIASMASYQRRFPDRGIWYVDIEKTFDETWAQYQGLDITPPEDGGTFVHTYPETSEQTSDMMHDACRIPDGSTESLFSLVVVDSIGGMESQKAFDKLAAEDIMGKNAQVITRMVKRTASLARTGRTTALLVNQHRANLSGYGGDLSAGPKAMQHSTAIKVTMRPASGDNTIRYQKFAGNQEPVAVKRVAKVDRSKLCAPGSRAEFWINNRQTDAYGPPGINVADEYVTMGLLLAVIQKRGSFFQIPGADQVQGREALAAQLIANPDLMETVRLGIFATDGAGADAVTDED